MRVVFVLEDLRIGGAQQHALTLADGLSPRFECEVVSLGVSAGEPIAIPAGVRVSHLGLRPLRPPAWMALARDLQARRADLIVTANPVATLAVAAARLRGGLRSPRVVTFHSTRLGSVGAALRTLPFIPVAWGCEALVYVSEAQRRHWSRRGLGARRVAVIPNGVPTDRLPPVAPAERAAAKARLGWGPQDAVFGVAAAMRPEKNLVQLADALADLRGQGVPARLLIVGDGPERAGVQARAQTRGVGDSLRITGLQADVRPFLAALDVGVLPSVAVETRSLFALEAMACGAPMVMSLIGGAAEIVTDGVDGRLVPPGDTPALVAALADCLTPAARARLSAAAVKTARTRFDAAPMLVAYAALFQSLIEAAGAPL